MRLSAAKFFGTAFAIVGALFGFACVVGDSAHQPVGMLLLPTAIGGFIALSVSGLFTARMKRPFGLIDGLRCTGWTLLGASVGLQQIAGAYYRYFWPQYAPLALMGALAGVVAGVLLVVLPSVLLTKPESPKPECCKACGYDLTGNTSDVCPECGLKP